MDGVGPAFGEPVDWAALAKRPSVTAAAGGAVFVTRLGLTSSAANSELAEDDPYNNDDEQGEGGRSLPYYEPGSA